MSSFNSGFDVQKILGLLKGRNTKIYFLGVRGEGMKPLAILAHSLGYSVGGSDARGAASDSQLSSILEVRSVTDSELVVYSLAIDEADAELVLAGSLGIPCISRAELLGALMLSYRWRVGVSGSHGKSTTTAAIDAIFSHAGIPLTTVPGAELSDGTHVRIEGRDTFVFEACEYKDSFLALFPSLLVITGVELDHTDYFCSLSHIADSFLRAAEKAERAVLLNIDCPTLRAIASRIRCVDVITYGAGPDADYRYISRGEGRFTVLRRREKYLDLSTPLIGEYNIANLTAAAAVADLSGIERGHIAAAIADFHGIARRMQRLCTLDERPVIYDYAHHPSEIVAAIDAVRAAFGECTVVFRPHTYSRTKSLWNDFITALSKADFTILMDIYPAREAPIDGITSERLAFEMGRRAVYLPTCEVVEHIRRRTRGAIVLMGAGDIDTVKEEILHKAKEI